MTVSGLSEEVPDGEEDAFDELDPFYAAPEQIRNTMAPMWTRETDVWSFGVLVSHSSALWTASSDLCDIRYPPTRSSLR